MKRITFIAAYDIADRHRLHLALKYARSFATGGQKSVHEVEMTHAEARHFTENMSNMIHDATDRFLLIRLDPRCVTLSAGRIDDDIVHDDYFYVA